MSTHGVNNAQAVKAGVVWGRQSDAAAGEGRQIGIING